MSADYRDIIYKRFKRASFNFDLNTGGPTLESFAQGKDKISFINFLLIVGSNNNPVPAPAATLGRFNSRKLIIHHPPHRQQQQSFRQQSMHQQRRSHDLLPQPPPPPPPPRPPISSLKMPLTAATLPRNFGQNNPHGQTRPASAVIRRSRQGTSSTAAMVVASSPPQGFMQLPSPPDPPSSFALSALVRTFFSSYTLG